MSNPSGDSTITGLPVAATLQGTEVTVIDQVQGGTLVTVKVSVNQLISQGLGTLLSGTVGQMLVLQSGNVAVFSNAATLIGSTITGSTIDSTPIGATIPSSGAFTTLTATTAMGVASGGTGRATLTNHGVLIGQGTAAINQTAVGTTGQMLLGVTGADPAFGNNPTITGGTIDGAVIGGTTKAAGSFTTIVATSTITPSSTAGIVGTTTNDNANAGSVGEFITANASAVSLSTGVAANVTSISLTAGDWDVTGQAVAVTAASTATTQWAVGINTTSATMPTAVSGFGVSILTGTLGTNTNPVACPMVTRVSVSGTTTVFLVAQATFSGGTMTTNGFIRARRVR